jgi:hypothetical protein
MKYRNNKIKKEHHILEGFDKFLNKMSQELPVKAIIPGVIRKVNRANKGDLRITFQYPTQTGAKILLKKGSSVQECFVVIEDITILEEYIQQEKYKN